jgi:hypothetical protein
MAYLAPPKSSKDYKQAGLIGSLGEGSYLQLILDQLLDSDIQPSPEDFTIRVNGREFAVRAAQLNSPMQAGSSWSVISLLLDYHLPKATDITVCYRPTQWFLSSLTDDKPLAPFEFITQIADMDSLDGIVVDLPAFDESELDSPKDEKADTLLADISAQPESALTGFEDDSAEGTEDPGEKSAALSAFDRYFDELLSEDSDARKDSTDAGATVDAGESEHIVNPGQQAKHRAGCGELTGSGELLAPDVSSCIDQADKKTVSSVPGSVSIFRSGEIPPEQSLAVKLPAKNYAERALTVLLLFALAAIGWIVLMLVYFALQLASVDKHSADENVVASSIVQAVEPAARVSCTLNYPDGGRYEGMCSQGKRDGQGVYYWPSGDTYRGGWSNDQQHGEGETVIASGKRLKGRWDRGKANGIFIITWPDGAQYAGSLQNGVQQGEGKLIYSNGDVYKGEFENNLKHGYGVMTWASGARYEGQYKEGKRQGKGKYWSTKGTRYEGMFWNGSFTRDGFCYQADGSKKAGACPP